MNVDPHEHHMLVEGPIRITGRWYGTCKCGLSFRGITREDIYLKAQTHVNQHNTDGGGDAA